MFAGSVVQKFHVMGLFQLNSTNSEQYLYQIISELAEVLTMYLMEKSEIFPTNLIP